MLTSSDIASLSKSIRGQQVISAAIEEPEGKGQYDFNRAARITMTLENGVELTCFDSWCGFGSIEGECYRRFVSWYGPHGWGSSRVAHLPQRLESIVEKLDHAAMSKVS